MKYPIDQQTFNENVNTLIENNKMQQVLIDKMSSLLSEALVAADTDDTDWYDESESLLKDLHSLKMYHESRRFNEDNFRQQHGFEPTDHTLDAVKHLEAMKNTEVIESDDQEHGAELSEDELERIFQTTRRNKRVKRQERRLQEMSDEEISSTSLPDLKKLLAKVTAEEVAADNSNDIYKIKARVSNLARGPGMQLTPQGVQLCNLFTHVLKSLYDFAERIHDAETRDRLVALLRSHEGMPGMLISAAGAGVKQSEKDKDKV